MKILKHGKVEVRKFVCPKCGCVFLADSTNVRYSVGTYYVVCPCCETGRNLTWKYGEPYEEPAPTQTYRDRLAKLLFDFMPMCNVGHYDLAADNLIANGVTFREDTDG